MRKKISRLISSGILLNDFSQYNRGLPFLIYILVVIPLAETVMAKNGRSAPLKVAVGIYAFVISTMGWRSVCRIGMKGENRTSQILGAVGTLSPLLL
jgi:hypothetical protein